MRVENAENARVLKRLKSRMKVSRGRCEAESRLRAIKGVESMEDARWALKRLRTQRTKRALKELRTQRTRRAKKMLRRVLRRLEED